jgi:hypothetical protein
MGKEEVPCWNRSCKRCGSLAINPHLHGRVKGVDLELCDVCYWRKRADDNSTCKMSLIDESDVLKWMKGIHIWGCNCLLKSCILIGSHEPDRCVTKELTIDNSRWNVMEHLGNEKDRLNMLALYPRFDRETTLRRITYSLDAADTKRNASQTEKKAK